MGNQQRSTPDISQYNNHLSSQENLSFQYIMAPIKELIILLGTCYIICLKATPLGQSYAQDKTYPQWKDIVSPKMEARAVCNAYRDDCDYTKEPNGNCCEGLTCTPDEFACFGMCCLKDSMVWN